MAKKIKTRTTVNAEAVKRDVKKAAKELAQNAPNERGHAEIPAGTLRRESPLEQNMGSAKYKQMVHDHNSKNKHILDRLPFTFPPKKKIRSHLSVHLECPKCGAGHWGTENTVGFVCSGCHEFVKPYNQKAVDRGYDPDLQVGIFGTATDKLRLLEERDKKRGQ